MRTVAVIIKHPYRDYDFRVDIYNVPLEMPSDKLYEYVMSQMLGPFEIVCITEKVSLNNEIKSKP